MFPTSFVLVNRGRKEIGSKILRLNAVAINSGFEKVFKINLFYRA